MRVIACWFAALSLTCIDTQAAAQIVARDATAAGSVIARKVGEEVRFIDVATWRAVEVEQDLLAGDVLRTNALGQLAVLFSDRTQVRLGRNTTMLVKAVGQGSDSVLGLQSGAIWARAERGGAGLTIEAPAASAAIRGTDWTMSVGPDGKTSIVVLEGLVEFSNSFGSVSVAQGEGAVASIGQAPSKVVIVDPDDRQQMLFHLSVRSAFAAMPASPLPSPRMRAERDRIGRIAEASRTAEDWLTLAEVSLSHDGMAGAREAAARARAAQLSASQQARIDLIDALAAGAEQRYGEAAQLFGRAAPRLDPRRRAIALHGAYFARSLAEPERMVPPPAIRDGGPYAALAQAWTAGFLEDIPAAIEVIRRAEALYPEEPALPGMRAQFAMLVDDRAQAREAIDRALALAPDDPTALEARAHFRAGLESDLDGALADLERAAQAAPGVSSIWNMTGLVQSERGADREAEAALRRAIELEPFDPVPRANLAILLLDQDRVAEAKAEIDRAMALDPNFDVALVARGRYHMQTGELDKAMQDLLAGTTANPAYAQALLLLSAGYYESGQREPAEQALENADRLDPNDPATSSVETAIAIDGYEASRAIAAAQETLKRSRARGGDYASLGASREAGSLLNSAFRLQGLDAWGRFYGDAVFDPFNGASYVDQAVSGSADPFANDLGSGSGPVEPAVNASGFSSLIQGLMLSPEMISGRSRSANMMRRPFVEGSVAVGYTGDRHDGGRIGEAEVQGFAAAPFPISIYGNVRAGESEEFRERIQPGGFAPYVGFDLANEFVSGLGYITARPTPNDRVVAYLDVQKPQERFSDAVVLINDPLLPFDALAYDRTVDLRSIRGGLGWSHSFAYRNVVNAAYFTSDLTQSSEELGTLFVTPVPVGLTAVNARTDQATHVGAVSHLLGIGDLSLRYGAEAGTLAQTRVEENTTVVIGTPPVTTLDARDIDIRVGRAYADALYEISPELKLEAGAFATIMDGSLELAHFEPRAGLAWTPAEGHWLRAGYLRETEAIGATTLAPIGVVGLQSNAAPLDIGGTADTLAMRWDAQWTPWLFTSLDYQHQELRGMSIDVPGSIIAIDGADGFDRGLIDRVAATANLHLGLGFGAFATIAHTHSQNRTPGGLAVALPFVPEISGRVGFTYVNPANLKLTLAATHVGERIGDAVGSMLSPYWTVDAALEWEPFDKRFALELAAYNIFDERFDVATNTPGWGPTFTGLFKVRF